MPGSGAEADMSGPKRPRILHVGKYYPPHRGGMETHLRQLATALNEDVESKVIVANHNRSTGVEWRDGVEVTRLGRWFNLAGAPICPQMPRKIAVARADLVHLHVPNPAAVISLMASRYSGRIVVTWHSDIVRQKRLAKVFEPVMRTFIRRCSRVIVSSPNYVQSSDFLLDNQEKCRIIPFGIDVARFQKRGIGAVASIREKFGPRIVLAVGRLVYYKGIKFLLRAMPKVNGNLVIVGDGPLRSELEDEARSLGIAERVAFLSGIEDLVPYYQACDIFVLPSIARSEAFGIVQLEAMAAGKPVVNTLLSSGVPFVSVNGQTGFSVSPRDPEALGAALNRLFDEPDLRSRFGAAGRDRVIREFTLERMTSQTLSLYRELLHGSAWGGRPEPAWNRRDVASQIGAGANL
jgi:glycosyltransferase involved in cell wall biosynthesis